MCIPILILDPKLLLENGPKGHFIMITALWPCSLYSPYKLPKDGSRKFWSISYSYWIIIRSKSIKIYILTSIYFSNTSFCSILQDSMASTYVDEGPLPWYRVEMSIFYIVFFVVFPFFFVNIFVALIIVTFNELGEAELQDDMDKNQVRIFQSFPA